MDTKPEKGVVFVIDTKPLRRLQLSRFVEGWCSERNLEVVPKDFAEILTADGLEHCRIVLLNIGGDRLSGTRSSSVFRVVRAMFPDSPIVIMSESEEPASVSAALEAGASAYLPSSLEADVALAALGFILAGGTYFPADLLRQPAAILPDRPTPPSGPVGRGPKVEKLIEMTSKTRSSEKPNGETSSLSAPQHSVSAPDRDMAHLTRGLTARQQEVLVCVCDGQSNKQIARVLGMSEATAKVHVRQLMRKLGAQNRTQAAVIACGSLVPSSASPTISSSKSSQDLESMWPRAVQG